MNNKLLLIVGATAVAGWLSAHAAVIGVPYWRVNLHQGAYIIAYGQGNTADEAWADCERLATTTSALPAGGQVQRAMGAITTNTVRWCDTPKKYFTIGRDQIVTCPTPPAVQTRSQACPTGSTGNWTQTSSSSVGPAPACTVTTTWMPTSAPSGACTVTPPPIEYGEATLSWTHDGRNLDGFRIVYGASPTALTNTVQLASPWLRSFVVPNLRPGTYHFAVKAYQGGTESDQSNIVSKVIR